MASRGDFSLGLVGGVVAGLTAAFVMNEFQSLWAAYDAETREKQESSTPATLKAADKASAALAGEPVPGPARKAASTGVHYLTGAVLGGLYGVAAEFFPGITAGGGVAYGGASWLVLDELVTPSLHLAPPPSQTAAKDHLYGLASHAVFGAVLELARTALTEALEPSRPYRA